MVFGALYVHGRSRRQMRMLCAEAWDSATEGAPLIAWEMRDQSRYGYQMYSVLGAKETLEIVVRRVAGLDAIGMSECAVGAGHWAKR
jgi:hypothetical protein